jgi:O-antigen ligase
MGGRVTRVGSSVQPTSRMPGNSSGRDPTHCTRTNGRSGSGERPQVLNLRGTLRSPDNSISQAGGIMRPRHQGSRAPVMEPVRPFGRGGRAPIPPTGFTPVSAPIIQPDGLVVRVGAVALFVLIFFSFGRITDFFLLYLHLPFVVSMICLAAALVNQNLLAAFHSRVGIALTAFSIWLVADIPLSVWHGGSFQLVSDTWVKSFSLFVVTAALLPSPRLCMRAIKVLAYAFLTTSMLAFAFGKVRDGRFALSQGLYMGSNELAAAMALGCIFWWFMIHDPERSMPKRVLSLIPLIPLLAIMIQTASRAGLIVLAVIVAMTFLRYSMRGRAVLAVVVVLGVIGGIALAPSTARGRFSTIFAGTDRGSGTPGEAVASTAQRAFLLKRSLAFTFENPVFGVGPGQFMVAENAAAHDQGVNGQWLGTHNTYTQISSECGIPALLFFLASIFFCFRELRVAEKIHRSFPHPGGAEYLAVAYTLRLALVSYVVFFCFEHIAYDPFYPTVAGIIVAFSRASRAMVSNQPAGFSPAAVMTPAVRMAR